MTEPAITVGKVGAWHRLDEPEDAPSCGVCGCSEPDVPNHHASSCPRYQPPSRRQIETLFEERQ